MQTAPQEVWQLGGMTLVPVQLEDERPVQDGEAQQADPAQQDAAEDAGLEVHDHDLRREWNNKRQPRLHQTVEGGKKRKQRAASVSHLPPTRWLLGHTIDNDTLCGMDNAFELRWWEVLFPTC